MKNYENYNYRLEFSEEQQRFFLSNRTHPAEASGYTTVLENCTNDNFKKFKKFLELNGKRPFYSSEFVKDSALIFSELNR